MSTLLPAEHKGIGDLYRLPPQAYADYEYHVEGKTFELHLDDDGVTVCYGSQEVVRSTVDDAIIWCDDQ